MFSPVLISFPLVKKVYGNTVKKVYFSEMNFLIPFSLGKPMVKFILIALAILFIQASVISLFRVTSSSMEDTLLIGDTMVVLDYWYGVDIPFSNFKIISGHKPQRGEVVLFQNPQNPSEILVKRCIAVGGQTVEIRAKEVFVDGVEVALPPHGKHLDNSIFPKGTSDRDFMKKIIIPDSTIFVLGDNRDFSGDSRVFGPVPEKNLTGKAWIVAWSLFPNVTWKDLKHKIRENRILIPVN
jgi:signal peptidase I